MKRAIAILIAFILVSSGMHLSIDRHYCGGRLADVRLSVTGKLASCGMEQEKRQSGNHPAFDKKCCDDQISYLNICSNYFPEYFSMSYPVSGKLVIPMQTGDLITDKSFHPGSYISYIPPGYNLKSRLSQSDICVFRI